MTDWPRRYVLAAGLVLACGCIFLMVVLAAITVRKLSAPAAGKPGVDFTVPAPPAAATGSGPAPTPTMSDARGQPAGHIVFTCQIHGDQICIVNADGSNYRRLTTDEFRHFYPSLAPDGSTVVYSEYREDNVYEIYELNLVDGLARRLTDRLGVLNAPEISPDGKFIVFMRDKAASDQYQVWTMDRNGGNLRPVFTGRGWDPTWSPDGSQIMFASDMNGSIQLYVVNSDGTAVRKISDLPAIRGRSDWSSRGLVATYSGEAWKREVYIMNADGSSPHRISPAGGNSQGPSFSPDGAWIAFTAYFDRFGEEAGCEIYIVRAEGGDLRRLTNNDYCDYQPRWGP